MKKDYNDSMEFYCFGFNSKLLASKPTNIYNLTNNVHYFNLDPDSLEPPTILSQVLTNFLQPNFTAI